MERVFVRHRDDLLLQRGEEKAYAIFVEFLNQYVIGKSFNDIASLLVVLAIWPQFSNMETQFPALNVDVQKKIIYATSGVGEYIIVALLAAEN